MRSLVPFLPLMAFSAVLTTIQVASLIQSDTLATGRLMDAAAGLFFLAWVVMDARRHRRVPCHEFGFLVALYMPVSLVWYVFWSRGWKGFRVLAGFAGLLLIPWVASVITYSILHGE